MSEVLLFILGACLGSFLTLLSDRLPKGEDVFWGRSHCDYCRKTLRWYELLPIVSYIFLQGRCGRCHKKLSLGYPIMEVVSGSIWLATGIYFATNPLLLVLYGTLWSALLVIVLADAKFHIIPDSMVLVVAICALVKFFLSPDPRLPFVVSATGAGLFFYFLWKITRGRGMGFGDVKLAIPLGLFWGYPQTILVLYVAFLTGACWGVILILLGKKKLKSHVAFGPFLILGWVVVFLFETQLLGIWNTFF